MDDVPMDASPSGHETMQPEDEEKVTLEQRARAKALLHKTSSSSRSSFEPCLGSTLQGEGHAKVDAEASSGVGVPGMCGHSTWRAESFTSIAGS